MFVRLFLLAVIVAACQAYTDVEPYSGRLNVYYAYTRETNRNIESFNGTVESVNDTTLALKTSTVVIIHGHEGTAFNTLNPTVKDALLQKEDVNVVVVDWSQYSLQSYENAVSAVPGVGTYVGQMIQNLVTAGVASLNETHIVGFGLGAHVAGYAGRSLNSDVARITGLDPSARLWGVNTRRLSFTDAQYVEVIHTDAYGLFATGLSDRLGHVDIYPNGGDGQPGCFLSNSCSHNRAWELFAASITHNHLNANQCKSMSQMRWNGCRGFLFPLGTNALVKLGSGIYRINTKRNYPF